MTTASTAHAVIRALIETVTSYTDPQSVVWPLAKRWLGENAAPLPDTPSPFLFTIFDATRSGMIENGGGRGHNRHRNPGQANIFVFVPQGWGLKPATDLAETFAALFRPYNQNGVVVESATVYPGGPGSEIAVPGMASEVGNYFWSACGVEFYHDLIG